MEEVPYYVGIVFILTTLLSIYLFYLAANKQKLVLYSTLAWITIQSLIALSGFYTETKTIPPRFILLVGPPLLFILYLFLSKAGNAWLMKLDLKHLTILHIIRIPVEMVLFWLFLAKTVPELMTFEGRNFDILSGLTAPIILWLAFKKEKTKTRLLIIWNIACLILLLNIVINAILSVPTVFQQQAFDQPNIALLYFPFVLLPTIVVPLVLLSHLAALKQLFKK